MKQTHLPISKVTDIFLGVSSSKVQSLAGPPLPLPNLPQSLWERFRWNSKISSSKKKEIRLIQVGDIVETSLPGQEGGPFEGRVLPAYFLKGVYSRVPEIPWERYEVRVGDIIMTCKGSTLKTALIGPETAGAIATSNIVVLRPDPTHILPHMLLAILRMPDIDDLIKHMSSSDGVGYPLTTKGLGPVKIPIPSMDVQHQLAETLESADRYVQDALIAIRSKRGLVRDLVNHATKYPSQNEKATE